MVTHLTTHPNWVQPAPASLEKRGSKIQDEGAPRMKFGLQEAVVSDVTGHSVDWLQQQNIRG